MNKPLLAQIGLGLAVVGLVVAAGILLIPGLNAPGQPLPLMVLGAAAFFYIPGSFLIFFVEKGDKQGPMTKKLLFVRFGFFVVLSVMMFQLLRS
jgi:hypothetical protein